MLDGKNETDPSSLIFLSFKDVYDLTCKPKHFLEMLIESCYSYPDIGDEGWCIDEGKLKP